MGLRFAAAASNQESAVALAERLAATLHTYYVDEYQNLIPPDESWLNARMNICRPPCDQRRDYAAFSNSRFGASTGSSLSELSPRDLCRVTSTDSISLVMLRRVSVLLATSTK
jgi:hypothetical protein